MGAVVYALDVKRVSNFYAAVGGLDVAEVSEDFVVLESSAWQLVVVAIPETIAVTIELTEPPTPRDDTAVKLSMPVASMSDCRPVVATYGGTLNADDRVWEFRGDRICDGVDPEGNVFQLRQRA